MNGLKNLFVSGRTCKYRQICPYYDEDSITCNNSIDRDYCGAYRRLDYIMSTDR